MEAIDQFKQKGYVQKLKANITPHLLQSHNNLVTLLYRQVTDIDGMHFIWLCTTYEQFYGRVKHTAWYPCDIWPHYLYIEIIFICTYVHRFHHLVHASV